MVKKGGNKIQILVDGNPASFLEVAEKSGDGYAWQRFLETHKRNRKLDDSAHLYLTDILGEYLSAQDISTVTRIKNPVITKWREKGLLKTTKLSGKWYYSVKTLIEAIARNTDQVIR